VVDDGSPRPVDGVAGTFRERLALHQSSPRGTRDRRRAQSRCRARPRRAPGFPPTMNGAPAPLAPALEARAMAARGRCWRPTLRRLNGQHRSAPPQPAGARSRVSALQQRSDNAGSLPELNLARCRRGSARSAGPSRVRDREDRDPLRALAPPGRPPDLTAPDKPVVTMPTRDAVVSGGQHFGYGAAPTFPPHARRYGRRSSGRGELLPRLVLSAYVRRDVRRASLRFCRGAAGANAAASMAEMLRHSS